jgi:hypothetical protein
MRPGLVKAIAAGGLIAGALDILDAIVMAYAMRGTAPGRVLQSVASGLIGRDAYAGGATTAWLGLGLHFFIATTAAAVYVLASARLPLLRRRAVACGLAFGLAVWAFMRYVVVPLSAIGGSGALTWIGLVNGVSIHALGVGLPIALAARRFLGRGSESAP